MDQGHHACLYTTTHDVDIMPFMIHRSGLLRAGLWAASHFAEPSGDSMAVGVEVCVFRRRPAKQHDEFSDISAKYWLAEVEMHPSRHRRP
jgi:hypothetical protein